MSDEPSYQEIMRAHRRGVLVKLMLVALVLMLALAATVHKPLMAHVEGWLHGDHDALGRSSWASPVVSTQPSDIAGLDLQRVHAELIPGWFVALANHPAEGDRVYAAEQALLLAVDNDAQLAALVTTMHALAVEDPWGHGDALIDLCGAWNEHLSARGQPWHLACNVVDLGSGPFFYAKSYRVEARLDAVLDGATAPLLVLRRVDTTNVREGYLGAVMEGDDQALVIVDRVREHALDSIWPLLDAAQDSERQPRDAAFAPHLRAGLAFSITPSQHDALEATAAARWQVLSVAQAVNQRQACGSPLVMGRAPWHGFAAQELDSLERTARADAGEACPRITLDEVDRLREATTTVRARQDLEPALEALVAWAARGTAVHELRHVADTRTHGAAPPPCEACDHLAIGAVREASAYLASFAHSESRYASLLQACEQTDGPHGDTIYWIDGELSRFCGAPQAGLAAAAAELERGTFGARDPILLPTGWPARLPVR